jgi:prevent-host-death family protein
MPDAYSLYDAKAKLSEIVRKVREGRTVTLTYRGEPVAEIRPIAKDPQTLAERLRALEDRGAVLPARRPGKLPPPVARKPGALKRFLAERHRF